MSGSGITHIGNNAFKNCASLGIVSLSDVLETTGYDVFVGCAVLTNVVPFLPNTVVSLGSSVFNGAPVAGDLILSNTNLVSIGDNAFLNTKIKSIYLGTGITYLPNNIFQNCTTVNQVWFCGDAPVFVGNPFSGWANFQARVYVPVKNESWEAYKENPNSLFDTLSPAEEEIFSETYLDEKLPVGKFWLPGMNSAYRQWLCTWKPPKDKWYITTLIIR